MSRHLRVYRLLLLLFPQRFRAVHGTHMERTFLDMWRERRHMGLAAQAGFWGHTIFDAVANALAEHRLVRASARRQGDGIPPTWSNTMSGMVSDIRYTVRRLARTPAFTAVAVLTLAFGVGANTVMFTLVNSIYLQPLPYDEPHQLVYVGQGEPSRELPASYPAYEYFRDNAGSLEDLGAVTGWGATLRHGEDPELLVGAAVSANLFNLLRVSPLIGRGFLPEEDHPEANDVVILSHATWQRLFGGRPDAIGETVRMGTSTYSVIGVMPDHFAFPNPQTTFWFPMKPVVREPTFMSLQMVGRLLTGVSFEQAAAEVRTVGDRLFEENRLAKNGEHTFLRTLQEQAVTSVGVRNASVFASFSVAVGLLLLIACANLTNLLLARASVRAGEIAVRRALGATMSRVAQIFVSESVLLALAGGVLGVVLSIWGTSVLLRYAPTLPRSDEIGIDGLVVVFALLLSLGAGVLIGLVPVIQQRKQDWSEHARTGARGTSGSSLQGTFAVVQMALTFALLVGAGLMARSLWQLQAIDPGFTPEGALIVRVTPPASRYPDARERMGYYDRLMERMRSFPRVTAVGATSFLPFEGWNTSEFLQEGQESVPVEELPDYEYDVVTAGFFEAMGIAIRAGRSFDHSDAAETLPVIVVNEALARQAWPNESALGKRLRRPGPGPVRWLTVVGVAADVKQQGLTTETVPKVYQPHTQLPWEYSMRIAMRTEADAPPEYISMVRVVVREFDAEPPLVRAQTLESWLNRRFARTRFNTVLMAAFTAAALALSMLGLYAVISFGVAQRTREIGVRIALGADSTNVQRSVIARGLKLALMGVAFGAAAALGLSHMLQAVLFGVSARDPVVYAGVAVLLMSVATLASGLPGMRASKVDPLVALRME